MTVVFFWSACIGIALAVLSLWAWRRLVTLPGIGGKRVADAPCEIHPIALGGRLVPPRTGGKGSAT